MTIDDAYERFTDFFGSEEPARTKGELRDLIHVAGILYEDIDEGFWNLAFGDDIDESWAYGTIDWPTVQQWYDFGVNDA